MTPQHIQIHPQTPTFNDFKHSMRTVIAEAIDCACDIVNDMSSDDMSLMTVNDIKQNALIQVQLTIDPDGDMILPNAIVTAVEEYVNMHLHFGLKFYS